MLTEGASHLEAVDVRRFGRLLYRHPELDHVEEKLQQVLVLTITALDGEAEVRLAILECKRRRQGDARMFSRLDDIERTLCPVKHETLSSLAQAYSRMTSDDSRNPSPARCHGDDPTFFVSSLDRGRARIKVSLEVFISRAGTFVLTRGTNRILGRGRWRLWLGAGLCVPLLKQVAVGIGLSLEGIRVAGTDCGIVALPVDELCALPRVLFREHSLNRLGGREVCVAEIEISIGEGEAHRLVDGVDVARAVIAHRFEVEVLKDIQGFEHGWPLCPGCELVNLYTFVRGLDRLLDSNLPVSEVLLGNKPAFFFRAARNLACDVAFVETIISGIDSFPTTLALS